MSRSISYKILSAIVFILLTSSCKNTGTSENSKDVIPVLILEQTDVDVPQTYIADIQAVHFVEIKPKIEGYIEAIYVDEGKKVRKGETIFRIKSAEFNEDLRESEAGYNIFYANSVFFTPHLQERINSYQQYYQGLERQHEITKQQYQIAGKQYKRDSQLQQKDVLSQQELENTQTQYLQSRLTLENSSCTLKNLQIRISELQETLLDYQQQYSDQKSKLESELNMNITSLINEINTWEMNYVFIAPFAGQITFSKYWAENQNIAAGESVFSIVSEKEDVVIGKALLPVARSGKVKTGQRVNIYLANYPDEEFGIVRGEVKNISLVPVDDFYTVEISLPDGSVTTYKKMLPFSQEMTANAEIITEDLRLLERIFLPIKRLIHGRT